MIRLDYWCAVTLCLVLVGCGGKTGDSSNRSSAASLGGASTTLPTSAGGISSTTTSTPASGGISAGTGGAVASGGAPIGGASTATSLGSGGIAGTGGGSTSPTCNATSPKYSDAALLQVGATDPADSVPLEAGGFFEHGEYRGTCYTYADAMGDGSTVFPPCGGVIDSTCFTEESGLCVRESVGVAKAGVWGVGVGCALGERSTGQSSDPVSIAGKHSLSVEVYGCRTPSQLRVQLNVDPPLYDPATDILHSGYYCVDVALPEPDVNGYRRVDVNIETLTEDCWNGTGPALLLDASKQTVAAMQLQVNAGTQREDYDFCISRFELD